MINLCVPAIFDDKYFETIVNMNRRPVYVILRSSLTQDHTNDISKADLVRLS